MRKFSQSLKTYTIGLIPADGIGKEVVPASRAVLEAVSPKYKFLELPAGFELFQRTGVALPPETMDDLKTRCDGAIFGAVSSPSHKVAGYSSPIVALRKQLDLYANVRPVSVPDGPKPIDMLIIRENTECLYIKKESETVDPKSGLRVATAERRITEYASRRIARTALDAALKRHEMRKTQKASTSPHSRPKVTIVHKANVLSVTDGVFRESCLAEATDPKYKDVKIEEQLVDSMVYKLFKAPEQFDVVVAPNMYGDIISDAAAALGGSLGMVAGANVGDTFVVGEPVHGSAPDIYGKNISNPIACIRSAALLLEYLGELEDAARINKAVDEVIKSISLTPDMGGTGSTDSVTEAIIKQLAH